MAGMYTVTFSLSHASTAESLKSIHGILNELGEPPPRPLGDTSLTADIVEMNTILESTEDETILCIEKTNLKKINTLMNILNLSAHLLHQTQPSLVGSTSLRMVELTLNFGVSPTAPMGFAHYGGVLASLGNYELAVRIGECNAVEHPMLTVEELIFALSQIITSF